MSVHDNAVDAINAAVTDPVIKTAMLYGSYLEGGWHAPFPVGDSGHSHGPFQINLPFHPGVSAAQADDAAFAVGYMLPSYQAARNQLGKSASTSEHDADYIAYHAERPALDYPQGRGQATVDAAYKAAVAAAGGGGSGGPSLPSGQITPGDLIGALNQGIEGITSPFTAIATFFTDAQTFLDKYLMPFMAHIFLPKTWGRVAAFTVGVTFMFIGVFLFFTKPGTATAIVEKVTETASTAAAAGAAA